LGGGPTDTDRTLKNRYKYKNINHSDGSLRCYGLQCTGEFFECFFDVSDLSGSEKHFQVLLQNLLLLFGQILKNKPLAHGHMDPLNNKQTTH
jgi:hypothetical protein